MTSSHALGLGRRLYPERGYWHGKGCPSGSIYRPWVLRPASGTALLPPQVFLYTLHNGPSQRSHPFLSVQIDRKNIQAPFTIVPFGCHSSFPVISSNPTVAGSPGIGFLMEFGQPTLAFSRLCPPFLVNNVTSRFSVPQGSHGCCVANRPLVIAMEELAHRLHFFISKMNQTVPPSA